jgi:hypothetical protein
MIDNKQIAKYILEEYANCYSQVDLGELAKYLDKAKAEAYKEFADRLKDMSEHFWEEKENFVSEEQIDNLLKELVRDNNESKN